ncbi:MULTISPECIES: MmgE/PrpD family protein [Haloferax]|uniref:2-methylcitrate dehydratase n=2 Tax=Haloferax TaxID=2251 RepID=A0A6G1Z6M9_9EURY|nr:MULTISPECIES: MmgE/PrpD family protein [Haloferax]KAB1185030.1 MmgE/PrpD family protein [Haloferax sp. CBA1149]MRW82206.1 2-methylcitrate dehydratase [Haloferax marinisediminis]
MIPQTAVRDWERQVYDFLNNEVPPDVRATGQRVVADVLAATVAGSAAPQNASVFREVTLADGPASVLGTDRRTDPAQAALLNVTAAITQEIEEGHNRGGHVGASIVAGAVGVAEAFDVDGETFVDACIRSYELCTRFEYAIFAMKARLNDAVPWLVRDPHSTWTTLGPALTAAVCMGHSRDEVRETVRTALNLAVVSMHDPFAEGAPSRNFTAGFSAQAGVSAATLAGAGLRGSAAAMEAVYDPFETLLGDGEFVDLFDSLGTEWWITEVYHKPYPSCRYTHAPLDALRDAGADGLGPEDVDHIDVYTYRNGVDMGHTRPDTLTAAKFSTPYVLARWVADGELTLDHFLDDALEEETVQALSERVHLYADNAYERAFPEKWGARVEVVANDGTQYVGERDVPRGDYRDPLTETILTARNRDLLVYGLGSDDVDDAVDALSSMDSKTVSAIVDGLTA